MNAPGFTIVNSRSLNIMSEFLCLCCLLLQLFGTCDNWEILHFHDNCGSTITEEAGELRFDARSMSTYLPQGKCSVTIDTEEFNLFSTKITKVLFYFTEFELASPCKDVNVTVEDGALYNGNKIKGLPFNICGTNKSLEHSDQVFNTGSDKLTLTVTRYSYGTSIRGTFIMKYVKLYTGTCEGNEVYRCANGNCIPSEYHCSDDIKACGLTEDECSFFESVGKAIERTLEDYSWVIIAVVALCVLRAFVKTNPTANRVVTSAWSSFKNICKRQDSTVNRLSDTGTTGQQIHGAGSTTEDFPRESDTPYRSDSFDVTVFEADDSHRISNDARNISTISETPSAPPPSYEEVMSSAYSGSMTGQANKEMVSSANSEEVMPPAYYECTTKNE